ncbi:hypothetical protein CC80DRAFT_497759 [Byssothecium circinans]|uniref:SMP-30/Gluconolactonase/LRE-like region domain-containing protein n=1 Tax=Byssothecium circinans TaxID=147558 RepID=A0A6A5T8U1_9PLEO|nr:hypothetical protein CC80DRAFT_497759 [Byssothecium circinans]
MRLSTLSITLLFSLATASPIANGNSNTNSITLATFPLFAENIAARSNNHLLITSLSTPSVQYLNPAKPNSTLSLPAIPEGNGISGITELSHDIFALTVSTWNLTERRGLNPSIWTLDFRHSDTAPVQKKIVNIPESTALNGLTSIPGTSILLAADSAAGAVYRIDTSNRTYSIAIQDPIFLPSPRLNLGINGVRVQNSFLYFVNSATGIFGRLPISRIGVVTGPIEVITTFDDGEVTGIDDFAVDKEGNAWIAAHPDRVIRVDRQGKQKVIVKVSEPTSLVFGRGGRREEGTIYVDTNVLGGEVITGGVEAVYVGKY